MKPFGVLLLSLLCCSLAAQPRCRQDVVFPFASCESACSHSNIYSCLQKAQFGCGLRWCGQNGLKCTLTATPPVCPNNEVPVEQVSVVPFRPVEFNLAFNLSELRRDVIFLIDASSSTRSALDSVRAELIKLVRNVSESYSVGVGIYGSEQSFDAKGFSVLQTVTSNVDEAVQALHNIPVLPDGPRTSMQALATLVGVRTVSGAMESFGFTSMSRIFVLIGDTPGREVPCDQASFVSIRQQLRRGNILAVSIGSPGLNAAIPALHCDNAAIPEAQDPIREGQAAEIVFGDVVQPPVTFEALFREYDRSRRLPPRGFFPGNWGRNVWVTQNTTGRMFPFFQMPVPVPLSDGCNERVQLSIPRPWPQPLQIPTQEVGTVRLSVQPWACRNGSFTCEVVIKDARTGQFNTPSSRRLDGHVHIVKVNAC